MKKHSEIETKHVGDESMHQSKAFSGFFYNLRLSKPVLQKIFKEFKTPKKKRQISFTVLLSQTAFRWFATVGSVRTKK